MIRKAREKQKAELDFRASGKERRDSWDYDEAMDILEALPPVIVIDARERKPVGSIYQR